MRTRQDGTACLRSAATLRPVVPGHLDVDHCNLSLAGPGRFDHVVAPRHLGDHFQVGFKLQQPADCRAEHRFIFGEQNPNHSLAGSSA
jgi:hypothetical protein